MASSSIIMYGKSPLDTVANALNGMTTLGKQTLWSVYDTVTGTCTRSVAVVAQITKDSGSFKNLSLLVTGILEGMQLYGFSTVRFDKLALSCKAFNEFVTAGSIISRVNEFVTGRAYLGADQSLNFAKLASNTSFLMYDLFGNFKWTEKVELVPAGTANALSQRLIGSQADLGRSFFGYMGCGFGIVESVLEIKKSCEEHGLSTKVINSKTLFSIAINTSRVVGFWAPKSTPISVGASICTAVLCISSSIVNSTAK